FAMAAYWRGDSDQALEILRGYEHLVGDSWRSGAGGLLMSLAFVATRTGQHELAIETAERGAALARASGGPTHHSTGLSNLAATVRFREQSGARGAQGDDASRARAERRLRTVLGDAEYEAQSAAGSALSIDEAIVLAINEATAFGRRERES